MIVSLLPAMLLGLMGLAPRGEASGGEREAVVEILTAYHAALQAGEPQGVGRLLGPSYFMADESSAAGSEQMSAHMYLTGAELQAWPRAFLNEAGPYRNEYRVLSVSIRGEAAVVLTRNTGSNRFRRWLDEEAAWFLGRASGQWRIVGLLIRDIQLPKER